MSECSGGCRPVENPRNLYMLAKVLMVTIGCPLHDPTIESSEDK